MTLYRELKEKKILLLDPDPWTRDSLALLLQWQGCDFASFDNVEDGHRAIDAEPYDIVICAHGAPGLDGLAFLEHCRACHPASARILIGTFAEPRYDGDGSPPVNGWIQKPLTIESVEKSLGDAILRARKDAVQDDDR